MKTQFSYRRPQKNTAGRGRLIAATAFVLLILLIDFITGGAVRIRTHTLSSGIYQWGSSVGGVILGSGFFSSRRSLESQNQALSERVAQLDEKEQSYDALKAENDSLRALLHVASGTTAIGITAPVVSSVRSSPYGTFLVGAGLADGIVRGSYVVTAGGVVVGIVGDVAARTSAVSEIFAPRQKEEGVIGTATVVVEGSGGGNAFAKIPRGLPVQIGDPVIAPRFGSRPIGVVGSIASSSASASQDVYIRIPLNFATQRYVYIIPPTN